jgi:hypothetical protein
MANADSYQNRTSYQSRRSKALKAAVQGAKVCTNLPPSMDRFFFSGTKN